MGIALNLINNDEGKIEKRVLPRFPLNYLTFKLVGDETKGLSAFSVIDISYSGTQLEKKYGEIELKLNDKIEGNLRWYGQNCYVSGSIKWIQGNRVGVQFDENSLMLKKVEAFLDISNFIDNLRPLHLDRYKMKKPQGLKYWLQAEGPVELFVWMNTDDTLSKFQIILFKDFVEWSSGEMKSGEVISKRNLETPLLTKEELAFRFDNNLDDLKVKKAKNFLERLGSKYFDSETSALMQRLLR